MTAITFLRFFFFTRRRTLPGAGSQKISNDVEKIFSRTPSHRDKTATWSPLPAPNIPQMYNIYIFRKNYIFSKVCQIALSDMEMLYYLPLEVNRNTLET